MLEVGRLDDRHVGAPVAVEIAHRDRARVGRLHRDVAEQLREERAIGRLEVHAERLPAAVAHDDVTTAVVVEVGDGQRARHLVRADVQRCPHGTGGVLQQQPEQRPGNRAGPAVGHHDILTRIPTEVADRDGGGVPPTC
jgi:uncharacterized protein YegJ (DUF2314 family)